MDTNTARLLPTLVYIQANLDGDLSLNRLAATAHLSPYHFHRLFRATIGETAKQYVQRLRLEQAAFRLKIQDLAVIDAAFDVGYHSHESFTRAFRRHFGMSPQTFKTNYRVNPVIPTTSGTSTLATSLPTLNNHATNHAISTVRIRTLEPLIVAFIRHRGDYADVDPTAYDRLICWAIETGRYTGDNVLLGVGHDDPSITATEHVRFDACVSVDEPFAASGEIGCQILPGGLHATTTYVGPYGPQLYEAHAAIFRQMHYHPDYTVIGLPALELYRTTQINPQYALNHTEIYMPITKNKAR